MRGDKEELRVLESRASKHDIESDVMRKLHTEKEYIVWNASITAIHSAVNEEEVGSKLQENDKCILGIKNELPTNNKETDQSVKIKVELGKLLDFILIII